MNATVSWDANTEPDLAGYQVFHGLSSGVYTPADTATVLVPTTTYQYTNLALGVTHYFAVKAFDTTGNLSAFSAEVSLRDEFPILVQDVRLPALSHRQQRAWDTDRSHMVSGFMAEVMGANIPPPPPETFPVYEAIGGFMIV